MRFIRGGAPSLKELSLEEAFGTPWSRLPLSEGLTELHLSATPRDNRTSWVHIPSFEQLLASLAELVSLQKLELSGYLPTATQANQGNMHPRRPPASFHALQELHLKDPAHRVVNFLSSIQIPNVTLVHIFLSGPEDVLLVRRTLLVLKSSWRNCQRSHLVDLRSFNVKRDPHTLDQMLGSTVCDCIEFDCQFAEGGGCPPRRLALHVGSADEANDHSGALLGAFTSELDFFHLHHLSIDSIEFFLTHDVWRALFNQVTHLQTITLTGCNELWGTFITLLKEGNQLAYQRNAGNGAALPISPFFPSLAALSLVGIHISACSAGNTFSDIVSALQERSELGLWPPLKLSLLDCKNISRSFERLLSTSFEHSSVSFDIVGDIYEESEDEETDHGDEEIDGGRETGEEMDEE